MNCLKCAIADTCVTDTSEKPCDLANSLPSLSVTSSNILHLNHLDADLNMPLDSNFGFYSTHDFHSNYDISECLLSDQSFSLINLSKLADRLLILQLLL